MHVTFLTRKYPPQKGGMEKFSYELKENYTGEHTLVHHGKRKIDIAWVAPLFVVRALLMRGKTDLFHLGDLVLGPIAPFIKWLTGKPVVVTVHALELTFDIGFGLYQRLLSWAMKTNTIDEYVAVSEFTANMLRERGVADHKITIITHGADAPESLNNEGARKALISELDIEPKRPILFTLGRLIRRKGVAWFIENVLPTIVEHNPLYVVASDGPDREHIEQAIERSGTQQYVRMLGFVSADMRENLYQGSDIWITPNVPTPGDAEGFGFVSIEAAARGLPVIASRLEGIPSAIIHEQNGILVEPENTEAFANQIAHWITNPEERKAFGANARQYTIDHFQWKEKVAEYKSLFERIAK